VGEAMTEGMAIVATRHGGIPEEITHEETGLLVDE
jgi:glycosyltransferase involved in cell wall biosynthesis